MRDETIEAIAKELAAKALRDFIIELNLDKYAKEDRLRIYRKLHEIANALCPRL